VNSNTCQVLAGVLPLILLTLVLERRLIAIKVRKLNWFRWLVRYTVVFSIVGIAWALVGVQLNGLTYSTAWPLWLIAATSLLSFGITVFFTLATHELEEDGELPTSAHP